jgi:two-component system NarL family response regulator
LKSERPIRVLLADDHVLMRAGVAAVINQQDDMQVVAEASNGGQVVELHHKHHPDVTVMDLRMPVLGGDAATAAIRREDPAARVLVLTIHKGDEAVHRALQAGARGYLLKDVPPQELLAAIRAVHDGGRWISRGVAESLAERVQYEPLSERETETLKLAARGLSNKQIAQRLDSTENAIKHVFTAILAKLAASDRAHAVALAVERNIIDLDAIALKDGRQGR